MNATHVVILNRQEPTRSNGWIHLVPRGELPNEDAGIVQVLDNKALDSILANLEAERKRLGENWPGLYAGEEHFIYNSDKSSEAYAWFKQFEKRANGIWGHESGLTDLGAEAVRNRRFKYTSFVAPRTALEPLGGNRYRVLGIETVGFTNYANGKHLLTPVVNRGGSERFRHGLGAAAGSEQTTKGQTKSMKTVAAKLGLSADAAEEAVLAEVTKIMNRATEAEGKVATMTTRVTNLEAQNQSLLGEQIDADLAGRGVTDEKVLNRVKPVLARLENRSERLAFLDDLGYTGERKEAAKEVQAGKVFNRSEAKSPDKKDGDAGKAGDGREAADRVMNRANELKSAAPGRTFESCWNQAQREQSKS